ncbi:MAG: ribosome silencing factor [Ignavibacterium sp.]
MNKIHQKIFNLIFEKKGYDLRLIDLKRITNIADYFIICSADSDVQVKAIADHIEEKLKDEGIRLWHKEGYSSLNWVLLDYIDFVIHIFRNEAREFYNLEKLWGDAPIQDIEDTTQKNLLIEEKPKRKTVRRSN